MNCVRGGGDKPRPYAGLRYTVRKIALKRLERLILQLLHEEVGVGLPLPVHYPARLGHGGQEYAVPPAVLRKASYPRHLGSFCCAATLATGKKEA